MSPAPITVTLKPGVRLELSMAGDEIVASLFHNKRQVLPTAKAVANSERVRTKAGLLHIGRTAFAIPESERRAVANFIIEAQSAS